MSGSPVDVLICGAGPTGLMLALWLTKLNVRVRIVDKTSGPGTTSRAIILHARNVEFYRQLGIADEVLAGAVQFDQVNLWVHRRKVGQARLDQVGEVFTPFPHIYIFPQDENERLLIKHLSAAGVTVERDLELASFSAGPSRVVAKLKRPDGSEEECFATYLAGCDGAHSSVRTALGIAFAGGGYGDLFYVGDVEATGAMANGEMHAALEKSEFLFVFPMKGQGRARLVGTVNNPPPNTHNLRWEDMNHDFLRRLDLKVKQVNWFSTYHVDHRIAQHFRSGRVFLLGDAAHVHSPVGGQGMNTGLGDAVNLAWKIAAVVHRSAPEQILDTYQIERRAFALKLVSTTDKGFKLVTRRSWFATFIRTQVAPRLFPLLFRFRFMRHLLFRAVSQLALNYRHSPLSDPKRRGLRGGDRLPADNTSANLKPLGSLEWQVHVYGSASRRLTAACNRNHLALEIFPWRQELKQMSLKKDVAYLIRPDGYVALADATPNLSHLLPYLQRWRPMAALEEAQPLRSLNYPAVLDQ